MYEALLSSELQGINSSYPLGVFERYVDHTHLIVGMLVLLDAIEL